MTEKIHIPDRPAKNKDDQETITTLHPKLINEIGKALAQKFHSGSDMESDIRNFPNLDQKAKKIVLTRMYVGLIVQFPNISLSQLGAFIHEITASYLEELSNLTQLI